MRAGIIVAGRRSRQILLSAFIVLAGAGCTDSPWPTKNFHPSIVNTLSLSSSYQGNGIALEGSLAYVSMAAIGSQSGTRSLMIVSLAKPAAPVLVSATSSGLASDMGGIVVSGSHAYVPYESASGTNFQVWDVSNPRNPFVAGGTSISCPAGMSPFSAPALYGHYVYVSCWKSEVTATGAFAILDVSNPVAPFVRGMVPVTAEYQPISFGVWGRNLYVAATQGGSTSDYVLLYSIADPASPQLLATVSIPHSPQWVAGEGTKALVPIYDGKELQIVDFSRPSAPKESSVKLGTCRPISVTVYEGSLALTPCDPPGGVAEVSLEAGSGAYLGTALDGTVFNFLAVSGGYLYGVDMSGNLETVGE